MARNTWLNLVSNFLVYGGSVHARWSFVEYWGCLKSHYKVFLNTLIFILQVWRAYHSMWCKVVLTRLSFSCQKCLKNIGRLLQCLGQPYNICLMRSWSALSPCIAFWIFFTWTVVRYGMSSQMMTSKPLILPFSCGLTLLRASAIGILTPWTCWQNQQHL